MRNNFKPVQIGLFDKIDNRVFITRERERAINFPHFFNDIISIDNLLDCWREFLVGKRKRKDVIRFSLKLTDKIIDLHKSLVDKTYRHGGYQAFRITDPKLRDIHKASVKDRLLHHAIYRQLYPYFDPKFIFDSYSCRLNKGTHRAINRFRRFGWIISKNNTRTVWVLKCDIKKFFANIDHQILLDILTKNIKDNDAIWLLKQVVSSFNTEGIVGIGLPLGNLTSQLLVTIYMNEFDHFVKRDLKVKYYIRYADDFVLLSRDRRYLEVLTSKMGEFLKKKLKLTIHPGKVSLKTLTSGVDFLGWVHFFNYRVIRQSTKKRIIINFGNNPNEESYQSYLGLLEHGNGKKVEQILDEIYFRNQLN
jgi:RNA-directed DNA polymerase